MVNNITLLKDLTALSAVGGNPFDYFDDIGIKEVAIYGNDDLVSIVWAYGFWSNIKVKYVFGDSSKDVSIDVGERTRSSILHISSDLPPENTIIVIIDKPKRELKMTISLRSLIAYSRKKRMLLDKVLKYKIDNPKVKVLIAGLPSLVYVQNKSMHEKALLSCSDNVVLEKNKVCQYLSDYIGDSTYGESIFKEAVFNTVKENGVYFLADKRTKYVNVVNGHRIVPNVPRKYNNTIYTFGNSLCMGMYTDDWHTIQYQLQERINECQNSRVSYDKYKVINAANGGQPNYSKMWKSIEYHKPKDGDIIVLIGWFDFMVRNNPKYSEYFEFCFPQQEIRLFDRPHNYGEYVWVDRVHLNCISYVKLGDCIADKLLVYCIIDI